MTYNDSILTSMENIIAEDGISNLDADEVDQRIIHHLINCAKNRFKKLFVSTGDADVLILLMSVLPPTNCLSVVEYFVGLALKRLRYYKVNGLCLSMANDVCIALPFFLCFYGV